MHVKPVLPPISMPVADSRNAPEVVVPSTGASGVVMASTSIGRSICGRWPSLSRKPARADTPDQRTHGVDKRHDEDGEHDRKRPSR